jgi:hypothetical protein
LVAILLPSVLAGCRDLKIGSDTWGYVERCYSLAKSCGSFVLFRDILYIEDFEPLFLLFTYIVAAYTNNVAWFLFFIQLIIILLVYLSAFELKRHIPICFSVLIYFFFFYGFSLNGTRQAMAQAFCLLSFSFLLNHKFLKSILVFLPALGFHITAFIYLSVYPIFFFATSEYFVHRRRIIEVIFVLIACTIVIYLDKIIHLSISLGILGDKFIKYATSDVWGSSFPLADFTHYFTFFVLLFFIQGKERDKIDYYHYFKYILLSCVILSFSGYISILTIRGAYYFSFLSILIIPMLLFYRQKIRKPFKYIFPFILCFFLFFWFMTVVIENFNETYPYTSKILGISNY